ncbi:prepilin peptidase [Janibacter corallicola]|uniref:prepilin peptidase n=1 Tax=Janibacter corallicola TaxID=415212 RepID=UPI000833C616|nr:prepilin peptidase [Janibacter corallicola]
MPLLLTALLGAIGTGVPAIVARRVLESGVHRYQDEEEIRRLNLSWLVPVAVLVGALVALAWRERPALAVVLVAASAVLLVLAAIDIDVRRLPDRLTYPLFLGGLAGLFVVGLIEGDLETDWVRALLGAAALGGFYFLLILIGGGGRMGLGDVKLSPSLGLLLGYLSWSHVVLGTLVGFLSAGVMALVLLVRGAGRTSHLAFGPHMVAGVLVVLALPAMGWVVS